MKYISISKAEQPDPDKAWKDAAARSGKKSTEVIERHTPISWRWEIIPPVNG